MVLSHQKAQQSFVFFSFFSLFFFLFLFVSFFLFFFLGFLKMGTNRFLMSVLPAYAYTKRRRIPVPHAFPVVRVGTFPFPNELASPAIAPLVA